MSEHRLASERDIERLAEKLGADETLHADIKTVLGNGLKHRANYIERESTNSTEKVKNEFGNYFKTEAKRLRELDPATRERLEQFTQRARILRFGQGEQTDVARQYRR